MAKEKETTKEAKLAELQEQINKLCEERDKVMRGEDGEK